MVRGVCVAGGCAWQVEGHAWGGGMCGKGACMAGGMHGRGMCDRGGMHGRRHTWQVGGMHNRGHVWQGACMAGGCAWQGCVAGGQIRSMSGRYASYWNAFLFMARAGANVHGVFQTVTPGLLNINVLL